jgi:hypothetical protein
MAFKYEPKHLAWLRDNRILFELTELTQRFNARFGASLEKRAIASTCKRYHIESGRDGRFKPGHVGYVAPKGTRSSQATEFKKGNKPKNYLPVGSKRINGDGYHETKIADPKKWKGDHILLWEQHFGPVPKGQCIIFIDGDKSKVEIDNLAMVSRGELGVLNKRRFSSQHNELKPALITLTKLEVLANKLSS